MAQVVPGLPGLLNGCLEIFIALLLHEQQLILPLEPGIPVQAVCHPQKDGAEPQKQNQQRDADDQIPLQHPACIERRLVMGNHKQIQRDKPQGQHPEDIPGLGKILILHHFPHAVGRGIVGRRRKQPAKEIVAHPRPQAEPWGGIHPVGIHQNGRINSPGNAFDAGKDGANRQRNRSGFPHGDPERFYIGSRRRKGQRPQHRSRRDAAALAQYAPRHGKHHQRRCHPHQALPCRVL